MINDEIENVINDSRSKLKSKLEMDQTEIDTLSDNEYTLMYELLGYTPERIKFLKQVNQEYSYLYSHSGHMMENVTVACLKKIYPSLKTHVNITNTKSDMPSYYNVDCIVDGNTVIEIKSKFSGATAKFTREKNKVEFLRSLHYKVVYLIFYESECNTSAHKSLKEYIQSVGGEIYYGQEAFDYIKMKTNIDMKKILKMSRDKLFFSFNN